MTETSSEGFRWSPSDGWDRAESSSSAASFVRKIFFASSAKKPIAEASRNIILTARTGKENGIIAVETENREGYVVLDGEYFDLLTEKTYKDKIEMVPYSVAVLQKKSADTSINR